MLYVFIKFKNIFSDLNDEVFKIINPKTLPVVKFPKFVLQIELSLKERFYNFVNVLFGVKNNSCYFTFRASLVSVLPSSI